MTNESRSIDFTGHMRTGLALALFCFSLYSILVEEVSEAVLRSVFLGFSLFWTFVLLTRRGPRSAPMRALDVVLGLASLGVTFYVALDYENIFSRAGAINTLDVVVAIAAIALVLEGTRRTAGAALPLLSIVFLLYPLWFGQHLSGLLRTGSFSLERVLTLQYLSLEGVIGSALQVTIEYVYLFVIFGAVLSRVGAIQFMDELARALCGRLLGASAKIATISSLFMGFASGSAVANVVSQGVFTIPMMRREGYKPEVAAAVEASASTGGQIMPPVMGAAAFLMAEYTRIPYSQIILYALVPGLLFYFAIWNAVHWEALRTGMKGIPQEDIPSTRKVLREGGLHILPLVVITAEMAMNRSMQIAVLHGIVTAIVVGLIHKRTRSLVTIPNLVGAIREGFRDSLALFTSAACAGIIIGVVTQTSFGLKISALVVDASMGMLWLALILCGIVCLILGMGLPTQIIYLTLAALVAPAIVKMGVTLAGAHLFIIYFGMMSMVTPPVCFAAFAAAGIAGSPFMRTGWVATKISIAGLLAPFYFAYHPGVMLMGPIEGILEGVFRAGLGLYAGSVGLGMFHWRRGELQETGASVVWIRRLFGGAACLLLIAPGVQALLAGVACVAVSAGVGPLLARRAPAPA